MSERNSKLAGGAVLVLALSLGPGSAGAAEGEPNDFVYQLQEIDLEAIGETKFDLVIMDYSRDGSDDEKFTAAQISALKDSPGGPETVLSYMSIGEAEDYRWYWQRSWDSNRDGRPDAGAPAWLGRSNPDWPGNYKARYWDPAWQAIVYDYVDRVLAASHDGVYLDIVDAYQHWEPREPGVPVEDEMVDFVKDIATNARERRGALPPPRLRPDRQRHRQGGPLLQRQPPPARRGGQMVRTTARPLQGRRKARPRYGLRHPSRQDRRLLPEGPISRLRPLRHAPRPRRPHYKPRPRARLGIRFRSTGLADTCCL